MYIQKIICTCLFVSSFQRGMCAAVDLLTDRHMSGQASIFEEVNTDFFQHLSLLSSLS